MLPAATRHPPELLAAEERYLISWGNREVARHAVLTAVFSAVLILLSIAHSAWWLLLLPPVLGLGALLILFFRNPRRRPPQDHGVLVAPADGRVVEVETVESVGTRDGEFLEGRARKVAIFLSIFDVHVNRVPASGRVEYLRHRRGQHLDARDPLCARENESQAVGLVLTGPEGPPGVKVLVRQISGAIARRIVCPLTSGQELERGRLMGMIKYGSRTELYCGPGPDGALPEVLVHVGAHVVGGQTVVFRFGASPERKEPEEPAREGR